MDGNIRIRAIYVNDLSFVGNTTGNKCPVFELSDDGYFRMLDDPECAYLEEIVYNDNDWIVFRADTMRHTTEVMKWKKLIGILVTLKRILTQPKKSKGRGIC